MDFQLIDGGKRFINLLLNDTFLPLKGQRDALKLAISKRKKQAGKTLFIDARKMGDMVSRKLRELTDEDIKKIADTYNAYVNGTLEDVKGFCAVVDTEKIAEQDYILTPGRYVGVEEQEDDGEPFEEKMARLTSELSDLFKQSHKLEAEIKEKLGAIGYHVE